MLTHCKNYANWLAVDKVIAKIIRLTVFGPPWIHTVFTLERIVVVYWRTSEQACLSYI